MTSALKKIYVVITGMLMAVATQLNGVICDQTPCCEPKCCEPECSTCCCDTCDLILSGELLYWRPELDGIESVFGDTTIAASTIGSIITTTVTESDKEPNYQWDPGFRVRVDAPVYCIDVDAEWTHFNGRATFREDTQHGHWKIRYDVVDLNLGRSFEVAPCFYFTPFIGVRGARIHQTLDSYLETLFTSTLIGENTVTTTINAKENFWGAGPRVGVEADWKIGCNFSLYACFSAVTYYGTVKGRNLNTDTFTTTISISNGRRKRCFNNIGTDGALGVRWERSFCCSCYEMCLMLKLGVEQHRIYDFSNLGTDGTLSLDGGVFAAGIGFNF